MFFNTSLLRMWLLDQPIGTTWELVAMQNPRPHPKPTETKLQLNKIHQRFLCTGKSEKHCFRLQPSGKFSLFAWLLNVQREVSQMLCVSPESQAKGEPCLRR